MSVDAWHACRRRAPSESCMSLRSSRATLIALPDFHPEFHQHELLDTGDQVHVGGGRPALRVGPERELQRDSLKRGHPYSAGT